MSLIIKKTITTDTGFEVSNLCVRLDILHHLRGDKVKVSANEYASKAAYDNGAQPIANQFIQSNVFEYDRVTDGPDVLQFAHEQFRKYIIDTYKTEPIIAVVDGKETTTGTTYFFTDSDIEILI